MVAKPHRQNSGFQLKFFLAGSCTTADGAYILMHGQLIDMRDKVNSVDSQIKRREAKIKAAEAKAAEAQEVLNVLGEDAPKSVRLKAEADLLDAEADLLEVQNGVATWDLNLRAARQELADIEAIMAELKPQCKYWSEDILEMSEACQAEEWAGELKQRAENFLLTAGTIPHDHFQTMRMHPSFKTELVPHITQLSKAIENKTMPEVMLGLEQPKLLGA